jgi:flavin-dependent dehydrogenase
MPSYEVIVVGLGAVGSAATWHLARLGTKVLGIDRYKPPHEFGSSSGETRLTRVAVVLLEKVAPFGRQIALLAGVILVAAGTWLLSMGVCLDSHARRAN